MVKYIIIGVRQILTGNSLGKKPNNYASNLALITT